MEVLQDQLGALNMVHYLLLYLSRHGVPVELALHLDRLRAEVLRVESDAIGYETNKHAFEVVVNGRFIGTLLTNASIKSEL